MRTVLNVLGLALLAVALSLLGLAAWLAVFGAEEGDDAPYHLWGAVFFGGIGAALLAGALLCFALRPRT